MKLITEAHLVGYNPRKDKSITLRFETGEKTPDQVRDIHTMLEMYGYVYFKPENQLTKAEVEELDNLDTDLYDKAKTQSQRLRNVLYMNWKTENKGFVEFKEYYKNETERIIQHYKDKLPD